MKLKNSSELMKKAQIGEHARPRLFVFTPLYRSAFEKTLEVGSIRKDTNENSIGGVSHVTSKLSYVKDLLWLEGGPKSRD